jgi:hypothetical protein
MVRKFGIDVGGVITDRQANDRADTSFLSDNFLNTTAVEGAFVSIAAIVASLGAKNVFIVSKCGSKVQDKTEVWLDHHRFFAATGMLREHKHFCRTREEKTPICKSLGISDFVDDRLDVLKFMDGTVERRFLFQPKSRAHLPPGIISVSGWSDLLGKAAIAHR